MKILFKIISIALAICVPLVAVFVKLFNVAAGMVGITLGEAVSLYDLYELLFPADNSSSMFSISEFWETLKSSTEALEPILPAAITFLVFFVLAAVIIPLVLIIVNIFKKAEKTTLFTAIAGLLCVIGMFISFNSMGASLVSGEVNIFDIFDLSALLSLATSFIEIKIFSLTSAGYLMAVVFGLIAIWSISYLAIDLGSPKERKRIKK